MNTTKKPLPSVETGTGAQTGKHQLIDSTTPAKKYDTENLQKIARENEGTTIGILAEFWLDDLAGSKEVK